MTQLPRSECPINLSVELLGDRWSLVILRDIMFGNRRHFRDLLALSDEGISSSVLAERLKMLVAAGMLSNVDDPTHKQRTIYSLTAKAIELVPVFVQLGAWGRRHLPVSAPLAIRARLLEEGGPELWNRFMAELREAHLHHKAVSTTDSVQAQLYAAYERELAAAAIA